MTPRRSDDYDARLQSLLCGELTAVARADLLSDLAEDAEAQAALADMLTVQSQSRRLFGLDCDDDEIKAGLAQLYAHQAVPK